MTEEVSSAWLQIWAKCGDSTLFLISNSRSGNKITITEGVTIKVKDVILPIVPTKEVTVEVTEIMEEATEEVAEEVTEKVTEEVEEDFMMVKKHEMGEFYIDQKNHAQMLMIFMGLKNFPFTGLSDLITNFALSVI